MRQHQLVLQLAPQRYSYAALRRAGRGLSLLLCQLNILLLCFSRSRLS